MQEIDQRDRELVVALEDEIPLVSTPFAFVGQTLDMSEKEVIKRTERLRRDGQIQHIGAQFDLRALGYRSCLVAAHVDPDRIDAAAAIVNAHPGVTRNYRRNNELNLWFTIFISPLSKLGLDQTIEILQRQTECASMRPLPTIHMYQGGAEGEALVDQETPGDPHELTAQEIEAIRLLQQELPLQPRPFDVLARETSVRPDELIAAARALAARGQLKRFAAAVQARKSGFGATAMGVWVVPEQRADEYATQFVKHRAVSRCHVRSGYPDWPYNLYTTVHARSVDECESVINDLAQDLGLREKQTLFPVKEYRRSRLDLFSRAAEDWERSWVGDQTAAAG